MDITSCKKVILPLRSLVFTSTVTTWSDFFLAAIQIEPKPRLLDRSLPSIAYENIILNRSHDHHFGFDRDFHIGPNPDHNYQQHHLHPSQQARRHESEIVPGRRNRYGQRRRARPQYRLPGLYGSLDGRRRCGRCWRWQNGCSSLGGVFSNIKC